MFQKGPEPLDLSFFCLETHSIFKSATSLFIHSMLNSLFSLYSALLCFFVEM
jgi:hypothetical protein